MGSLLYLGLCMVRVCLHLVLLTYLGACCHGVDTSARNDVIFYCATWQRACMYGSDHIVTGNRLIDHARMHIHSVELDFDTSPDFFEAVICTFCLLDVSVLELSDAKRGQASYLQYSF